MITRAFLIGFILFLFPASVGYAYDEAYESGVRHFRERDYRRAIPHLDNYVSRRPDPAGYYMLGYALYHLGDYEKSREYFDQAYLIDPEFTSGKVPPHAGLSRDEERLIHDALALSGARSQMNYYADILSSSLPLVQRSMSKERAAQDLHALFRSSFSPGRLYPSVVSSFSARFNRGHILAVIQWFTSPLGKKMASVGAETYTPVEIPLAAAYTESIEKMPDPRRRVIETLEKTLSATDYKIDIVSTSLFGLLKGMQSQLGEGSSMNSSEVEALAGNVRDMLREEMAKHVLLSLSHACRSLSDEEIGAAIRFYASPAGRWFHETCMDALRTAIGNACRETGERIGKTLALKRLAV